MDISIIAMAVAGLSTSLICFLLGTIYGKNTAYETISTYQPTDTQDGDHDAWKALFANGKWPSVREQYQVYRDYGRAYRKGLQKGREEVQADQ